jgi:hypothetical protein
MMCDFPIGPPKLDHATIGLFDGDGGALSKPPAGDALGAVAEVVTAQELPNGLRNRRKTAGSQGKRTRINGKILGEGAGQRRNHYGCSHPDAVVPGMRYVIVICAVTFFLIWDGLYNQGRYLDTTVREITRIVRYISSMV